VTFPLGIEWNGRFSRAPLQLSQSDGLEEALSPERRIRLRNWSNCRVKATVG